MFIYFIYLIYLFNIIHLTFQDHNINNKKRTLENIEKANGDQMKRQGYEDILLKKKSSSPPPPVK
jgi:hypothetical protein